MDSKLQIISGAHRGRKLMLPDGARPTQNRARAAIFNMLASGILGSDGDILVWDAFAGSGALGIELLSRYDNARAIFSDVSDAAVRVIRQNLGGAAIDMRRYRIDTNDALNLIWKYADKVDLVFVDPPYDTPRAGIDFVAALGARGRADLLVVQEVERTVDYTPDSAIWEILRDKTYGRARFLILRRRCV